MMVGTLMNSMKFSHNFRTRSQRGIWTHLASESWRRWIGVTTGWESLPGIPIESKMTCHPKFNPKHSSQDVGSFLLYVGSVEESMSWSVWGVSHFASCPFDFVAVWCFLSLDLLAILSDHHWLEFATSAQENAPSSTLRLLGETLGFGSVRHQICWMSFVFDFELSPSSV